MANGYVESAGKVDEYLKELKRILCSENFDLDTDIDILFGVVEGSTGYKNAKTIQELGYNKSDIRNTLLSLTVNDYSETLPDTSNSNLPPLYVFNKMISVKEVYIKLKIRDREKQQVFCLSFHFAQYPMLKPYSA